MQSFRNVSPLGALDLALVGRVVAPGEVITVTDAQAVHLTGQEGTWEPVKATPTPRSAPDRGKAAKAPRPAPTPEPAPAARENEER